MQNNKIGSGLQNLGNTCFFNAVMQIMLYTPQLASILLAKDHSSSCQRSQWCIFCALQRLWHQSKKNRVVSPNSIVSNLRHIFKKFRLGRQQDSHEFLRYLIEGMQDAQTGKLGKQRQKNDKIINKTFSYNIFGGRIRTFVLCLNCHHKSLTSQRYYDLSIQCQRSNTLQEGLDSFFKVQDLGGANKYKCDSCKQLSNAKKGFKIMSIPSVITFQLKRFTNSLRKIGKVVQYPKTINLSRYLDQEGDPEDYKFELYGIVVHSGSSSSSGHYYSFIKNNNEWFEMNDSNVSRCSQERVYRQQAYLLFYSKIQGPGHSKKYEEESEILTNIKENLVKNQEKTASKKPDFQAKQKQSKAKMANQKSKSNQQQKQKEKDKDKEKQRQKGKNKYDERLDDIKRKLSMDIEQMKQGMRKSQTYRNNKQDNKSHEHSKSAEKALILNGKIINAPLFGSNQNLSKIDKNLSKIDKNNNLEKKIEAKQDQGQKMSQHQSDDEFDIEPPSKLVKRKSKQQAFSNLKTNELLFLYSNKILQLQEKLPTRKKNRALRSIQKLRKYEITSKRRKLGFD